MVFLCLSIENQFFLWKITFFQVVFNGLTTKGPSAGALPGDFGEFSFGKVGGFIHMDNLSIRFFQEQINGNTSESESVYPSAIWRYEKMLKIYHMENVQRPSEDQE